MFSADNIVNLNESFYRDKSRPMVFLSHKHDEQDILQDVVAFLKEEGVDVYVDWMDSSMPAYTNAETAHSLKQKIKIADKFILVATPNAINSKWCNWELGLGDAAKYKEHIALLPIDKTYETYAKNSSWSVNEDECIYDNETARPNVTASSFTIPFPQEDLVFNSHLSEDAIHVDVRATYSY